MIITKTNLIKHYSDFLDLKNNKLVSQNLSDLETQNLYDKKYNLTDFEIYKFITAYDYINDSLGCNKFTLTEGISSDINKYNNILIDLFYNNIPSNVIVQYPISIIFGIKQVGQDIEDLSKLEKINNLFLSDPEANDSYALNYWTEEYNLYKSIYKNYTGNSYTYYIFKQLIKLFLTEVYLYKYNTHILTYNELLIYYNIYYYKHQDPSTKKSISQWINDNEIVKVKYSCIKVSEPNDINGLPLSHLKLYLIDVNSFKSYNKSFDILVGNFNENWDKNLIEKSFSNFWDYDQELKNKIFLKENLFEVEENKNIFLLNLYKP